MNIIKQHIKLNQYKKVYLLYGTESYLKKLYKDKLKTGILGGSDEMNFTFFEGKSADITKIKGISETMPFFAERRLIIIENSGWFKASTEFDEYIKVMPETTHIVFVESEVDKRNKLYKAVKLDGYISEMNVMDDKNIKLFAVSLFKKEKINITEAALSYFIEMTGSDMNNIVNEAEKLICFVLGKDEITLDDIKNICTEQLTSRIFLMIDEIAMNKQKQALSLYYDLIALKEKPMSILYLLIRHFNILLQVKELMAYESDRRLIAEKASIPPFAAGKYMKQAASFSKKQIKDFIEQGIDYEEKIKTGRIDENIGTLLTILGNG